MLTTIRAYPERKNRARVVDAFGEIHFFTIPEFKVLERIGGQDHIRTLTPPDTVVILVDDQYFLAVDPYENFPAGGDTVKVRVRGISEGASHGGDIEVGMDQIVRFEKEA